MPRVRWSVPVVGLMLVACTSQVAPPVQPRPSGARRPAVGSPSTAPANDIASAAPATSIVPAGGVPAATTAIRTLAGTVRAPAAIVTNNGAGLISDNGAIVLSNNGATLISDNGGAVVSTGGAGVVSTGGSGVVSNGGAAAIGRYVLLEAPAQALVAGARVELRDASGKPVAGPDGAPLVATTDGQGRYAFEQALPPGHLVVSVELGATAGQLVAIAPPTGAARTADLDVVSTLTSTYILDRYVRAQDDPTATLGKLPADVEAETRVLTAGAVAGGKVPLPTALTTSRVVATVDALRAAEPTLDAQMDVVKRLLIPAGQSDLGTGQLATSVNLGRVDGLLLTPTGELLLATTRIPAGSGIARQGRIWRLGTDGRLAVAVTDSSTFINGTDASGASQPAFRAFGVDAAGRPLIADAGRIGRIEADGTVIPLGDLGGEGGPVRVGEAGTVWAIARAAVAGDTDARPMSLRLVASGPGADARTRAASPGVPGVSPIALAPDGRVTVWDLTKHQRHAYDPATDAWTTAPEPAATGLWSVDPAGNVFVVDAATRGVSQREADGTLRPLIAALPPEVSLSQFGETIDLANLEIGTFSVCAAPNGAAYLSDYRNRVYRLADGKATLVAGIAAATAASGDANAVSLEQPVAVAALPGGDIVIADTGRKQLLRVTPDRKIAVWGGSGQAGFAKEGQAIAEAPLAGVIRLLVDSRGDLIVFQQTLVSSEFIGAATPDPMTLMGATPAQLLRIGADGVVHVAARIDFAFPVMNSAVLAGDAPHVSTALAGVQRLGAAGLARVDLGPSGLPGPGSPGAGLVAGDAAGKLWLFSATGSLSTCLPPAAPQVVSTDPRVAGLMDVTQTFVHGVVDGQGRLCFGDSQRGCVWRFDSRDSTFTSLAGQGGRIFTGTTPDDSIGAPKDLCFAPDGALLVLDGASKQVKRIPPDKL